MRDKIIELDNKTKYVVADEFSYSDKSILVLGKLNKKDEATDLEFAELVEGKIKIITDKDIISKLDEVCKMNLN